MSWAWGGAVRVLLTGQVGLEKGDYLGDLKEAASEKEVSLEFESVGQWMIEFSEGDITDQTILDLPFDRRQELRRRAWEEIETRAKESEDSIFIANSHAVLRWEHGLFPAIDLDLTARFQPDVLVTLIDDVQNVKAGLQRRDTDIFELWEILAWREEEVWLTKLLAESLSRLRKNEHGPLFYVLPKAQGPELLLRLLTEPAAAKAYLSFPITALHEERDPKVEGFKDEVSEVLIAFDPYSITERAIRQTALSLKPEIEEDLIDQLEVRTGMAKEQLEEICRSVWERWGEDAPLCLGEFDVQTPEGSYITLSGHETRSVLQAIDKQIVSRDFLLIAQSDMVTMYIRPDEGGEPDISAGCVSEMIYARFHGKPVYVVFPGDHELLSPFVKQFSRSFADTESLLGHVSGKHVSPQ
jgi:adenylate kinase